MLASEIIDRVKEVLQDSASVTWTETQLIAWLNDAQRTVVLARPDASSTTTSIALVSGTKQEIPSNGIRLLEVIRNMGVGGAVPGRAIMYVDRRTLDENSPDWHADTETAEAKGYTHDSRDPSVFYVTPPSDGTTEVEAMYSVAPADISAAGDTISIPDTYGPAMIEWILYRAFSRDSTQSPNYQRGASHKQSFMDLLGLKTSADTSNAPRMVKTATGVAS